MSIELNKPKYVVDCESVGFMEVAWYVFRKEYVKSVFGIVREKVTMVYSSNYKECEAVAEALREYNK